MTQRKVLVTSALPYSNGRLHVGHIVGAYLPADTYVRFLRLRGAEVRFICGSDDHGVAIMLTAQKEGKSPAEVAKYYHGVQNEAFKGLNINFDIYSSTSRNPYHQGLSQEFFATMLERGFFEKKSSRQFFDPVKNTFLPDRFVKGTCGYCATPDQNGDQCEQCGKMLDVENLRDARSVMSGAPATVRDTVHWFIDLSRFQEGVRAWLEKATLRDHTKKYVEGLLSSSLVKRSMTRDISWGIPLPIKDPDAQGKVLYVWFDAPIGYISNTKELGVTRGEGEDSYRSWWQGEECEKYHFIGEDNTIFHCVVWIAMLMGEGSYSLPRGVIVNQFMNIQFPGKEETKISKSRGTAIWVDEYLKEGGDPDAMRYYLSLIATERSKSTYNPEELIQRQNSELANVIGNFVNRILSFTIKNYGPSVPQCAQGKINDIDRRFAEALAATHKSMTDLLENFQFKAGIETAMEFARACNKYVDEKAPWTSRKTDEELTKVTLNYSIQAIKALSILLAPYLPNTSDKIAAMLKLESAQRNWDEALKSLPAGAPLGEPVLLFAKQ